MPEEKDFYHTSVTGDPMPIKYIDFPDTEINITIDFPDTEINITKDNVKRYKINKIKDSYGDKFQY